MHSGSNRRNYYRILHVQPDAPAAVLKSSYRALMLTLEMHPDRGGEHWNAALVNEAYSVLSDETKRAAYDRTIDMGPIRSGRPTGAPAQSSGPGFETHTEVVRVQDSAPSCIFCGADAVGAPTSANSSCRTCRSPLTPAGGTTHEASGRRAAQRVAREGRIRYYIDWPQPAPLPGQIVDLSPRGLRFETSSPLQEFQIIKLDGELLDAVARVAACTDADGAFSVGVEFYTVRFNQHRGTYLSTQA